MHTIQTITLVTAPLAKASAQGPHQPADQGVQGTHFLDHDTPLQGFWGRTFLKDNIPYLDIPDPTIRKSLPLRVCLTNRTYRETCRGYLLLSLFSRSEAFALRASGVGYMITEFMQPVSYAGAFGSIDAAAGHHIEEAQWLRSTFYDQDYLHLWTRRPVIALNIQ